MESKVIWEISADHVLDYPTFHPIVPINLLSKQVGRVKLRSATALGNCSCITLPSHIHVGRMHCSTSCIRAVVTRPTGLQGEGEVIDQRPGQARTGIRAPFVAAAVQNMLALAGQALQVVTKDVVEALVEAHDIDRCHGLAMFHPQTGETGHAGLAAIVDEIQVQGLLVHVAGLADFVVVQAHEVGGFALVVEQQHFACGKSLVGRFPGCGPHRTEC